MKCYVHIGLEKTGTTSIQKWLYQNLRNLSQNKIYLSKILGVPNNRLLPSYFQGFLDDWTFSKNIKSMTQKKLFFKNFLVEFSREIETAKQNHETFIITSEHLHSRVREKSEIQELYSFLSDNFEEIYLISYFREQYDLAVSLYSTALKVGYKQDLETFLLQANTSNYYYNLLQIADNWSDIFCKENCRFRIYDKRQFINNDLRVDFIRQINNEIDLSSLDYSLGPSNSSLSTLEAFIIREINNKSNSEEQRLRLISEVASYNVLKIGKLSSPNSENIRKLFTEINKEFFAKYFNGNELFDYSNTNLGGDHYPNELLNIIDICFKLATDFESKNISNESINLIRDVALKNYDGEILNKNECLELMKIALEQRPYGKLMLQKTKLWSKELGGEEYQ